MKAIRLLFVLFIVVAGKCANAQQAHPGDSLALRQVWLGLNGPNWQRHFYFPDWSASKPVRNWRGVTLDAAGRVTAIEIQVNGCPIQVSGDIHPAIGQLTELRSFQIIRGFIGRVPNEITQCTKLRQFAVLHEHSTGPTILPSGMGIMDSLRVLHVPRTQVLFNQLEPLSAIPFTDFGTRRDLSIPYRTYRADEGGQVTLVANVPGQYNQYQWFKEGQPIAGANNPTLVLTNVQEADCKEYHVEVTNLVVFGVTVVRRVNVEMASNLRNDSLAVVSVFRHLNGPKWPAAYTSKWLTTAPLSSWPGLNVQGGRVTGLQLLIDSVRGTVPDSIYQLARLKTFFIFGVAGKTQWAFDSRLSQLAQLDYFHLKDMSLAGADLAALGQLPLLKTLMFFNTEINRALPDVFANSRQLEVFLFNSCGLTGTVPPSLRNLPAVRYLSLAGNQLSGEVPYAKTVRASTMFAQGLDVGSNNYTSISPAAVANGYDVVVVGNRIHPYALNHPSTRFSVTNGVFVGTQQLLEREELRLLATGSPVELVAPFAADTVIAGFRHRFDGWYRKQGTNTVRLSSVPRHAFYINPYDTGAYYYRVVTTTNPDNRAIMTSTRANLRFRIANCLRTTDLSKPLVRNYCAGDSLVLKAATSCDTCQHLWYRNGQLLTATDTVLVVKESGIYRLVQRAAGGCEGLSDTLALQFNALPMPAIISRDTMSCGQPLVLIRAKHANEQWVVNGRVLPLASDTLVLDTTATVALLTQNGSCQLQTPARRYHVMPGGYDIDLSARAYCFPANGKVWVKDAPRGSVVTWFRNDTLLNAAIGDTLQFTRGGNYFALIQTGVCQITSYQAGIEHLAPPALTVRQQDSLLVASAPEAATLRWLDSQGNVVSTDSTLVSVTGGLYIAEATYAGGQGCFSTQSVTATGLQTVINDRQWQVYPNPGQDMVTLSGTKLNGINQVLVTNSLGQQWTLPVQQTSAQQLQVNTSRLLAGLYTIRVGDLAPLRWVKQN